MSARWLILGDPDWPPLQAFACGLRLIGIDPFWAPVERWRDGACDAAVIYGLRNHGVDIAAHYAAAGKPLIVIDHGYMKRVMTRENIATGHFQVGLGRIGWVPDRAPSGDRLAALGIAPQARPQRPLKRALIMGQVAYDASHRKTHAQLTHAYERLAEELSEIGARTVAFRPHPLGMDVTPNIKRDEMSPIEDAIERADLVASINSNAGLDALIAGAPAVTLLASHYDCLAYRWPVMARAIAAPPAETVRAHLERLAYAQWTAAEMAEALPHRFLQSIGAVP